MFRVNLLIGLSIVHFFFALTSCVSETSRDKVRHRRQLLFPNSTLLQFNVGIGTPTLAKMINLNYAFQANFQLPWNRSQIPVDLLHANGGYDGYSRKKRDVNSFETNELESDGGYESDAKLYHFYQYLEEILNGFGHNGTSCVLQTLCQIGAEPFHSDDEEDLLHEIASFVLNPTNDASHDLTEKDDQYRFIEAYERGHKGEDCIRMYEGCKTCVVDLFSKLHDKA